MSSIFNEIQARCEAATPGEWEYDGESEGIFVSYYTSPGNGMVREMPFITVGIDTPEETGNDEPFYYVAVSEEDAEFIAHARQDIPYLLSEAERLASELAAYKQAEAEGLLVRLPCKVGDIIFSFCWSIKNQKYELRTGEAKNVRYDSVDGSAMVSDGDRYYAWGSGAFPTREAATNALQERGGEI